MSSEHLNGAVPADPPLSDEARSQSAPADPAAAVPTTNEQNGHAVKPTMVPDWPLLNWNNTPQNTACVAFILGAVFAFGLSNIRSLLETQKRPDGRLARFMAALLGPRLGVYIACLVIFHMMEFLTTAIWNPKKVEVRSFLLEDQKHNAAHAFAFIEYLLEETFFPDQWLQYKHSHGLLALGLVVTLAAQYLRSLAMATAATNFSHLIVYEKAPAHSLVRTGIYGWSRHPSYVAFFYWALGTQILVCNPISFFAFSAILYRFFDHRIKVEEWYLVRFFGTDYVNYQREVPARIPFIR